MTTTNTAVATLKAAADEAQRVALEAKRSLHALKTRARTSQWATEQEIAAAQALVAETQARWDAAEEALDEANGGEW